eukprot:530416_1
MGKKLILYALHLTAGADTDQREKEAKHVKTKIKSDVKNDDNYVLVTGDFNTPPSLKKRTLTNIQLANNAWIGLYAPPKINADVELRDTSDGISVKSSGNSDLVLNSILDSITWTVKQAVTHTNQNQPPNIVQLRTWLQNAARDPTLVEVVIQCDGSLTRLSSNTKANWSPVTADKLGSMELTNDGLRGIKITYHGGKRKGPCDQNSHIDDVIVTTQPADVQTQRSLENKRIADLTLIVTNDIPNDNTLRETIIKSVQVQCEETLSIFGSYLEQLNSDNTQPNKKKYSHKACGTNLYEIFDYFYASDNLIAVMDGKMTYEHNGGFQDATEYICDGYSDHTPIKVVFKTEGDLESAHTMYDNYYN